MVRTLNNNKKEHLKNELKLEFPNLTDSEVEMMDKSFEDMIDSISQRTNRNREEVAKIVENKVDYIHSKHVF